VLSHWSREEQPLSLRERNLGPVDLQTSQQKWHVHWLVASAKKVKDAQIFYLMVPGFQKSIAVMGGSQTSSLCLSSKSNV